MTRLIRQILSLLIILTITGPLAAQTMDTPAPNAILVEEATDTILFAKNADEPFPPASMSKLMTVYVAFDLINQGVARLDDTHIISDETWREWRGRGSTMFLNAGDEVTIADLLRGIIVQSGNDACVALAKALAGSEATFVEWMNAKARELGMENSHFVNSNGWPAEGHVMSARDLAILAEHTIGDFPKLYGMYAERSFTYGIDPTTGNPITQRNRNPILGVVQGVDGLKTGHTEEAGYGLTASAVRGDRRIILVLTGLDSEAARARESQRLIEYAFRNFQTYDFFSEGEVVDEADVWLGQQGRVPLVAGEDVSITMSRADRMNMEAVLEYESPIPAPIAEGTPLATITIRVNGEDRRVIPLLAGASIEEIGGLGRIGAAFQYVIFGSAPAPDAGQ